MNLTTQLRIILLAAGVAVLLVIYFLGRRNNKSPKPLSQPVAEPDAAADHAITFNTNAADDLDEEALETPAYMRRNGVREPRQDYSPRIADAHDYAFTEVESQHGETDQDDYQQGDDIVVTSAQLHTTHVHEPLHAEPIYNEMPYNEPVYTHLEPSKATDEPSTMHEFANRQLHEPILVNNSFVNAAPASQTSQPFHAAQSRAEIPVMADSLSVTQSAVLAAQRDSVRAERSASQAPVTPTLSQVVTPAPGATTRSDVASGSSAVATPSSPVNKTAPAGTRRKIIALRLPMPERVPGAQLLALLHDEQLQHGKFNIFHRLHAAGTVFSVASMVEPGSFEVALMPEQHFAGVTLFMLLPGPLDGLVAYDQMLSCAQRLAHATHSVLHDERGNKLTPQSMQRLREEVLDFQHLIGGVDTSH